jgi:hypothetical protein
METTMSGSVFLLVTMLPSQIVRVEPAEIGKQLVGKRIVVEGVYSGSSRKDGQLVFSIRFCKSVRFRPGNQPIDNLRGNLEITGDVRLAGEDVVVDVVKLRALPDDLEQFNERRSQIAQEDYEAWYRLAKWAEGRSQLYQRTDLAAEAKSAYRVGFAIERKAAKGKPEALEQLAKRIRQLPASLELDNDDLDHEILHARFSTLDRTSPEQLVSFAAELRQHFQIDRGPMPRPLEAPARQQYDADPIGAFQRASEPARRQLIRYWEVGILRAVDNLRFERGEIDALKLAELSAKQMSDYPEVSKHWFDRAVADYEAQPERHSAEQAEALSAAVRTTSRDEERAQQLLLIWLERREGRLLSEERAAEERARRQGLPAPPQNSRERLELAANYLRWVTGPRGAAEAARLLILVATIDPSLTEAESLLRKLGYSKTTEGRWMLRTGPEHAEGTVDLTAVRPGMSAAEVLRSLGEPAARARLVTKSSVVHQWVYRLNQRTIYLFLKEPVDGTPRVSSIRTVP